MEIDFDLTEKETLLLFEKQIVAEEVVILKWNNLLYRRLAFLKWFLKSSHCCFPMVESYVTSKNLCDSKYLIDTAVSLSCSCIHLSGNERLGNRYFASELKIYSVFSIIYGVSGNTSPILHNSLWYYLLENQLFWMQLKVFISVTNCAF